MLPSEGIEKVVDKNGKDLGIITRPNASSGFWLCFLIPAAYMISNCRYPNSSLNFDYKMTTITSFGLLLQSLNIFLGLSFNSNKYLKITMSLIPGACTSFLYVVCLKQIIFTSLFWAYITTLLYYYSYVKIMKALPRSFTYGEASIVVQGFVLFLLNATLQVPVYVKEPPATDFLEMNAIMLAALLCLAVTTWLIYTVKLLRHVFLFYPLMVILVVAVCMVPVTEDFPVVTLFYFITNNVKRIFIIIFYFGLIGLTITAVGWQMDKSEKATTEIRKIFHVLIVCVYIPGLLYQCTLLYIASGIIFSLFVVLETFRLAEITPFAEYFHKSVNAFIDEKDAGNIALTPFYLLVGCSLPMWISPCPCMTTDSVGIYLLPMASGIISIGVGDSAASIVGSKFGRHKWKNSSKSIEGTLASIIFQALTVCAFHYFGFIKLTEYAVLYASTAILISSITEALTDQVDNLVLPLLFYIFCSGKL